MSKRTLMEQLVEGNAPANWRTFTPNHPDFPKLISFSDAYLFGQWTICNKEANLYAIFELPSWGVWVKNSNNNDETKGYYQYIGESPSNNLDFFVNDPDTVINLVSNSSTPGGQLLPLKRIASGGSVLQSKRQRIDLEEGEIFADDIGAKMINKSIPTTYSMENIIVSLMNTPLRTQIRIKMYLYFLQNTMQLPVRCEALKHCLAKVPCQLILETFVSFMNNEMRFEVSEDDDIKEPVIEDQEKEALFYFLAYLFVRCHNENQLMDKLGQLGQLDVINGTVESIVTREKWTLFDIDFEFMRTESAKFLPSYVWQKISDHLFRIMKIQYPLFYTPDQHDRILPLLQVGAYSREHYICALEFLTVKFFEFSHEAKYQEAANLFYAIESATEDGFDSQESSYIIDLQHDILESLKKANGFNINGEVELDILSHLILRAYNIGFRQKILKGEPDFSQSWHSEFLKVSKAYLEYANYFFSKMDVILQILNRNKSKMSILVSLLCLNCATHGTSKLKDEQIAIIKKLCVEYTVPEISIDKQAEWQIMQLDRIVVAIQSCSTGHVDWSDTLSLCAQLNAMDI